MPPKAPEGAQNGSKPQMGKVPSEEPKEDPTKESPINNEVVEKKEKTVEEDADDVEEIQHRFGGVGVIVVRDGKILTATRIKGKGTGLMGGPGGHIEEGETPKMAAIRETIEEFKIVPKDLVRIGSKLETGTGVKVGGDNAEHLRSTVFLCTEFEGEPECDNYEMAIPVWRDLAELNLMDDRMFKPFKDGLKMLKNKVARGIMENKNSWDGKS